MSVPPLSDITTWDAKTVEFEQLKQKSLELTAKISFFAIPIISAGSLVGFFVLSPRFLPAAIYTLFIAYQPLMDLTHHRPIKLAGEIAENIQSYYQKNEKSS